MLPFPLGQRPERKVGVPIGRGVGERDVFCLLRSLTGGLEALIVLHSAFEETAEKSAAVVRGTLQPSVSGVALRNQFRPRVGP